MEKINDGGPAFPLPLGNENIDPSVAGMSLRAYLAGMALQGIMTQPGSCSIDYAGMNTDVALANADALIAKLEMKS